MQHHIIWVSETIKNIYRNVLTYNRKIEYLGEDKYRITSYYSSGEKCWKQEYQNEQRHGNYVWWYKDGRNYWEGKYQNGIRVE